MTTAVRARRVHRFVWLSSAVGAWQPCGVLAARFFLVAQQGSNFCTAAYVQHVQRAARRAASAQTKRRSKIDAQTSLDLVFEKSDDPSFAHGTGSLHAPDETSVKASGVRH